VADLTLHPQHSILQASARQVVRVVAVQIDPAAGTAKVLDPCRIYRCGSAVAELTLGHAARPRFLELLIFFELASHGSRKLRRKARWDVLDPDGSLTRLGQLAAEMLHLPHDLGVWREQARSVLGAATSAHHHVEHRDVRSPGGEQLVDLA
jgi:hypothetical protein